MTIPIENVTRLTVVDERGNSYERYDVQLQYSLQDDGRTLKVFVDPRPQEYEEGTIAKLHYGNDYAAFAEYTEGSWKFANGMTAWELRHPTKIEVIYEP